MIRILEDPEKSQSSIFRHNLEIMGMIRGFPFHTGKKNAFSNTAIPIDHMDTRREIDVLSFFLEFVKMNCKTEISHGSDSE